MHCACQQLLCRDCSRAVLSFVADIGAGIVVNMQYVVARVTLDCKPLFFVSLLTLRVDARLREVISALSHCTSTINIRAASARARLSFSYARAPCHLREVTGTQLRSSSSPTWDAFDRAPFQRPASSPPSSRPRTTIRSSASFTARTRWLPAAATDIAEEFLKEREHGVCRDKWESSSSFMWSCPNYE